MRPRFHGRHSSGRRPGGARRARRRIDRTSRKRRAITGGRVRIFYSPDLAYIHERAEALACVDLHVGDGASLDRSIVRKSGDALIGHAPVRTQLTWCQEEKVPRTIITHCGSQIVKGDERTLGAVLRGIADGRGV